MAMSADGVVLVTGGSRGIGAATAKLAGKRGWSVALSYVGNEKAANETVAAVEAAGGKAIAVQGDVAKAADVRRPAAARNRGFPGGKRAVLRS
jgi:NAD(P)-dependent dehydrogenase (short-subunit alcohol dehydrogenase family)